MYGCEADPSHWLPQAAQSHKRTLEVVEAGYMTISFTDEDCNEARYNFTARRDALVSAGAQIIKTDFPTPATFFPSNYTVCSIAGHQHDKQQSLALCF